MYFSIAIFIVMVIGVCLIVVSLVWLINARSKSSGSFEKALDIKISESKHSEISGDSLTANKHLAENFSDEVVHNSLNAAAKAIFTELEEKRQELLLLYYMIEDRKKEIFSELAETLIKENKERSNLYSNDLKEKISSFSSINKTSPMSGRIQAMFDKGASEEEIAKSLGIGQGEVKLILNLGKGR